MISLPRLCSIALSCVLGIIAGGCSGPTAATNDAGASGTDSGPAAESDGGSIDATLPQTDAGLAAGTVLWSGRVNCGSQCWMAADDARLYVADLDGTNDTLTAVNKDGSGTTALASLPIIQNKSGSDAVAVNGTDVFWAARKDAIYKVPKSGGTPVQVASGTAYAMVADDSSLFWTVFSGGLWKVGVDGTGMAQTHADGLATSLVMDTTDVYWLGPGKVERIGKDGSGFQVIAQGAYGGGLAVDSDFIYWADVTPSIDRAAKDGSNAQILQLAGTNTMAVDDTHIYFVIGLGSTVQARVVRTMKDGSMPTVLWETRGQVFDLAVDNNAVYALGIVGTGPASIWRIPK